MAVPGNASSCSLSAMWDWSHLSLAGTPPALTLLDAATDLLLLERNYAGALELCERGLQMAGTEPGRREDHQVKASLAVIAIQALAEMEQWREVLPWLLQYYRRPQEVPPNIMEMCLLLYGRVKQPHVMLEVSRDWLTGHAAHPSPQYKRVAELHLLNVLLPLGRFLEAEELALDPRVFTKPQQEVALAAVKEEKRRLEEEEAAKERAGLQRGSAVSPSGDVRGRWLLVARLICRALSAALTWTRQTPVRPALLAVLLLAVIVLRLDPASPSSHGPIRRLLLLIRQAFAALLRSP